MGLANVSLAERFLPLVICEHQSRSICYQNVIDLQDTGLLAELESMDSCLALSTHASRLRYSHFVWAMRALGEAMSFGQSTDLQSVEVVIGDESFALGAEHFLLDRIESLLADVAASVPGETGCRALFTRCLASMSHDHVMAFYRTLEILPARPEVCVEPRNEVIVHIPRVLDGVSLSDTARRKLFAHTFEMLKLYCYPGIHHTGFAASLTPVVTMGSIGVMRYGQNKGFDMLEQVLREQQSILAAAPAASAA